MQSTEPIRSLIDTLARSAIPRPHIEHVPDPKQPGRLFYRITGSTREAVQSAITDLINKVADGFGYAVFETPRRTSGGYIAQGAVVVFEASVTL